jgi:hypothetical protein
MKRWICIGFVAVGMLMMAQTAAAQFLPWISEISAFGGTTIGGDDLPIAGAALTLNVSPQLGGEVEISVMLDSGDVAAFNANLNAVLNLGTGSSLMVPYVTGGAGIFDGELKVIDDDGTYIAINAGGGVKMFIDLNMALRIDFRAFLMTDSGDLEDLERIYAGLDFVF